MKEIRCNKCGKNVAIKFFNSEKVTCDNCYTKICFNDYKAYRIIKFIIIIVVGLVAAELAFCMKLGMLAVPIMILVKVVIFVCIVVIEKAFLNKIGIILHKRNKTGDGSRVLKKSQF